MLAVLAIFVLAVYIYLGFKMPAIALVTSPFVACALFLLGVTDENEAVVVIAPLVFLAALVAVLASTRGPDKQEWPQTSAKVILTAIVIFIPVALVGFILIASVNAFEFSDSGFIWFSIVSLGVIVFTVVTIGAAVSCGLASRHSVAAHILSTIGSSMRQNLPLPMALESATNGRTDLRSKTLRAIQKWLIQGYSLSESIKRGYPACPGHAVAMIAAAERIDQLPFAMEAIEADLVAKADERRRIRPVHPFYPAILIFLMFFIALGLMAFVIPQFKSALDEMAAGRLPWATRLLIEILRFVTFDFGWVLGIALVLIVLVGARLSIYLKFRPRRPRQPYLLSRIADFFKWHLPILHSFEKNYSLIQVVELLRLSLGAGCTVNDAIDNAIGLDVNNCFKKRLRRCLGKIERGDNISAAIIESRLSPTLAWAFDEKVNRGNTLSILEMLESFYRSNYSYSVNLARFIMWPCVMVVLGAVVGFAVYAIFAPGIEVIKVLVGMVTP